MAKAGGCPTGASIAVSPKGGFGQVTSVCPTTELGPSEGVEASIDGLAHTDAVVVCPARMVGLS